MKSRKDGRNTHEWEFDEETVLDDWSHGKELYDKGLIKTVLRSVIWRVGTYEEGSSANTDSPHSKGWCPGLSELSRMKEK